MGRRPGCGVIRPTVDEARDTSRDGGGAATPRLSAPARLGFLAAAAVLLLDQATKLFGLFVLDLPLTEPIRLGPFLDLVAHWNRGISYGLFQQSSEAGRWLLLAISAAASAALSVWIARAGGPLLAASLGLILGGAVGNAIDRLAYGAVFDFVHFHVGAWSWYVFNVADAAIVAGVAGLIYDSLVLDRRTPPASG
jgi:signal peptidase II